MVFIAKLIVRSTCFGHRYAYHQKEQNRILCGFEPFRARCTQPLRQALCAPCSVPSQRSPVPLAKFQMAPTPSILMSSGSKKKEPRYLCLSEAKTSHSPKICTDISSLVPHFLQVGLLLSPITCRCLLKVLCPVSRPITAQDCVLLKDNYQTGQ